MKAFMLAAGLGKRLLPLTQDKPKPLLKVGGIPLIQRNLMKLKDSNISEVVINVHYLGEQIINFLGDGSDYEMKISYSIEKDLLGTGGGIRKSIHHFEDPFIVLSSDTWSDFDFKHLSLNKDKLAHMILVPNPKTNSYGDVSLKGDLISGDKSEETFTFSGISIMSPEIFLNYPKDQAVSHLWNDFLSVAASKDLVTGEVYEGNYENLNTIEDIERLDGLLSEE
ncbi:MAG: nucleotidyltransferase family protein [Pseudomonadota bacterium]|nr:nucleotidyltransferase family protein [Pseudomonadota bacterium]